MGKLQIRGGSGEVPQLAPREPYFDGENLHVGKLDGSGNQKIAAGTGHDKGFFANEAAIIAAHPVGQPGWFVRNGETDTVWVWDVEGEAWVDSGASGIGGGEPATNVQVVEWPLGDPKPVLEVDLMTGDFVEGKNHMVLTITLPDETTVAEVTVIDENRPQFSLSEISTWGSILTHAICPDGSIIVAPDGGNDGNLRKYSSSGQENLDFTANVPQISLEVYAIIAASDYILIGGSFDGCIKKLSPLGVEDAAFTANLPVLVGTIYCMEVDNSGNIYIGGSIGEGVKKLSPTGIEDAAFTANVSTTFDDDVMSIEIDTEGSIFIGGFFTNYIVKLTSAGVVDVSFSANPALDGEVNAIKSDSAGNLIIGGDFTGDIKKLSPLGVEDAAFTANVPALGYGYFYDLKIADDGSIYAGGNFPELQGHLKKFSAAGVPDEDFEGKLPELNNGVNTITLLQDNSIVASGDFSGVMIRVMLDGITYKGFEDYIHSLIIRFKAQVFNESSSMHVINKPGKYVERSEIGEHIVDVDTTNMIPGDVVIIYNSSLNNLVLGFTCANYAIGAPLPPFNYVEVMVDDDNGDKILVMLYASSYVGLQQ